MTKKVLHSLFILRENGICVFERHWIETDIDAHLFSGFITALSAFAVESMGKTFQSLKLVKEQRLAILKHPYAPIIGVIIADYRDNGYLLNKILEKILNKFYQIFQTEIKIEDASLIGKTKEKFPQEIDIILKGKTAERSFVSLFIGFLAGSGLSVIIILFILSWGINFAYGGGIQNLFFAPIFINLFDGMQPWEFLDIQQIAVIAMGLVFVFFLLTYFGPGLLGAYIAGNRKLGVINGLLSVIGGLLIALIFQNIQLFLYSINMLPVFVGFSPLIIILNILTGYFGGLLREIYRLYPLPGKDISEKVMKHVTILVKKTFPSLDKSED